MRDLAVVILIVVLGVVLSTAVAAFQWKEVEAIRAGLVQQRDDYGNVLWAKPPAAPPAPKLEK